MSENIKLEDPFCYCICKRNSISVFISRSSFSAKVVILSNDHIVFGFVDKKVRWPKQSEHDSALINIHIFRRVLIEHFSRKLIWSLIKNKKILKFPFASFSESVIWIWSLLFTQEKPTMAKQISVKDSSSSIRIDHIQQWKMQEILNPFHGQNFLISKGFSNFEHTSSKNSLSSTVHYFRKPKSSWFMCKMPVKRISFLMLYEVYRSRIPWPLSTVFSRKAAANSQSALMLRIYQETINFATKQIICASNLDSIPTSFFWFREFFCSIFSALLANK